MSTGSPVRREETLCFHAFGNISAGAGKCTRCGVQSWEQSARGPGTLSDAPEQGGKVSFAGGLCDPRSIKVVSGCFRVVLQATCAHYQLRIFDAETQHLRSSLSG